MPRNESRNDKEEKPRLTLDERLREKGEELQRQLVFSDRDFTPHLEVLSIVHIARTEGEGLSPADQRRLKRMMGLQMKTTPKIHKTAGDSRFWSEIDEFAGKEILRADQFADDLSDMPKSWQSAQSSLTRLQAALKAQRGEG